MRLLDGGRQPGMLGTPHREIWVSLQRPLDRLRVRRDDADRGLIDGVGVSRIIASAIEEALVLVGNLPDIRMQNVAVLVADSVAQASQFGAGGSTTQATDTDVEIIEDRLQRGNREIRVAGRVEMWTRRCRALALGAQERIARCLLDG